MSRSGYVDVPGGQLYYEEDGAGPPLTLIHAGVAHLRMWDEQVAAWRDRFRVIRYDTRGFGRTRTEDVPYSNRDDLAALLDALEVESTHLLGASRGGMIALDFTVERPERVRSLTWVAGGLRGLEADDDPRLADVGPQVERLEEARDWPALVELETQVWTDGPGQPPDRVDPDVRRRMVQWNLESYQADQQANQVIPTDWKTAERLGEISVPTLFVWGTLDESTVAAAGEHLTANVAGAQKQVVEGVAHMVNLERPDEFNQIVEGFLVEAAAPAYDAVEDALVRLIGGTASPEAIANWATEIVVVGPEVDDAIWDAVNALAGVDTRLPHDGPAPAAAPHFAAEYLYQKADFIAWLEELRSSRIGRSR